MKQFLVDFETYYSTKDDISVSTQGVTNHVEASSAYMVSIAGDSLPTPFVGSIEEARKKFPTSFWMDPSNEFWAANANFDEAWANKEFGLAEQGDVMRPWKCLLDHGATEQLPGNLAGMASAVLGRKIDKTLRDWMDGKHYEDLKPEDQKALLEYCKGDSVEALSILKQLPVPSAVEQEIAAHTRMTNRRGVQIDEARMKQDREALLYHQHAAFTAIPWHEDEKPLSPKALATWCKSKGIVAPPNLAKDDEDSIEVISADPALAEVVGHMRAFRKSNTLIKKLDSVEGRIRPDGTMGLELMYCGARHTRRWSSRGVNVQNLDAKPYEFALGDKQYGVWTRQWLVARPGKIFYIPDFAQIEPRCLNWLVGNDEMLDMMRKGVSVYEASARISGVWKSPGVLKDEDPALYKRIKAEVLGLGYGMGAKKFVGQAAKGGIVLTEEEARTAVLGWRGRNPKIPAMWKAFDKQILDTVMAKEKTLEIVMPTGDKLRHFALRPTTTIVEDEETGKKTAKRGYKSYSIKGDYGYASVQNSLWGGVLVENVVQRMARDVMAEAVLRLEKAGLPVLFHSHDEVILEVDIMSQVEAKAEADQIMRTPPEWASSLPLDVDGDFSYTYTK